MATEPGPPAHQPDQIIVDLHHHDTVTGMLDGLGVTYAEQSAEDVDEHLGLGRLRDLTGADGEPLDVDDLIARLREQAAGERGGWVPVLGKNRDVDAVIGDGLVESSGHKPMDNGEPEPAGADELPPGGGVDAGRGVRVGIVDTPRPAVPDTDGTFPYRSGHSTFVAGLIARSAPAAAIEVGGALLGATGRSDSWSIAREMMRQVVELRADILNLSLGCFTSAGGPPLVIARAIERIGDDVLVVAAAGNHGDYDQLMRGRTSRSPSWPAGVPKVVAVGAVDADGSRPSWSPDQRWLTCSAPGVRVVSTYLDGPVELSGGPLDFSGYARWSGTSFAAATVTGAVAARTVPGSTSPRQALADLIRERTLVLPFPVPS